MTKQIGSAYKKNTLTHKLCPRCREMFSRDEMAGAYCKPCKLEYERSRGWHKQGPKSRNRHNASLKEARKKLKAKCVERLGGKCTNCGYVGYLAAMDFHHIGEKLDEISYLTMRAARVKDSGWMDALNAELAKCILLCRNCHMALHAGEWELASLHLENVGV